MSTYFLAAWLSVAAALGQNSWVCRETVERYRDGRRIDTVTASLLVVDGVERYSDLLRDGRPLASWSALAGAWSRGEYSALWGGGEWRASLPGYPALRLRFRERRAGLRVERRADRQAFPKSSGIERMAWTLVLQAVAGIGPVPRQAVYLVRYRDGRVEENRIGFDDFQRFATDSRVVFPERR